MIDILGVYGTSPTKTLIKVQKLKRLIPGAKVMGPTFAALVEFIRWLKRIILDKNNEKSGQIKIKFAVAILRP